MADVTWPDQFEPAVFEWGLRANVIMTTSTFTGGVQTSEIPGARWVCRIVLPQDVLDAQQAVVDAWAASVRGQANRVLLWHLKRPFPRGSMRTGTIASAPQGATQAALSGDGDLKEGDMVGINIGTSIPQLVEVTAYAGGVANFSPPLRRAAVAGSALALDRPKAKFISMTPEIMVPYGPARLNPGLAVDFAEVFA